MKIPKYIKQALDSRERAAESFNRNDIIVSEFIDKYDIEIDSCHYHGGVESLVNPASSKLEIIAAIQNK